MEKVVVYSTGTCAYCEALMEWLDELGVEYEERNAAERDDIRAVPVTVIGDTEIVGFDRPAVRKALEANGWL